VQGGRPPDERCPRAGAPHASTHIHLLTMCHHLLLIHTYHLHLNRIPSIRSLASGRTHALDVREASVRCTDGRHSRGAASECAHSAPMYKYADRSITMTFKMSASRCAAALYAMRVHCDARSTLRVARSRRRRGVRGGVDWCESREERCPPVPVGSSS
jgi:hypothetical protein